MKKGFGQIASTIESDRKEMAETLARMVGIKAISPAAGGDGEGKKADFLQRLLKSWGFSVRRYNYLDNTKTVRPNLVVRFGEQQRTLWVIAHIDTVAEGARQLWKTDPFKGKISGGKVFGRGTADDGTGVIASIFTLKALKQSGAKLKHNIGVALVADEEIGSKYGAQKLLNEGIFGKKDMILVPDFDTPKGDQIEIGEKGLLWLKVTVNGKQVHASEPEKGENAYRYAIRFLSAADEYLHKKYNAKERPFETKSTFEMTKHEKNVDSINMIPGVEVSYLDLRTMPRYSLDSILRDLRKIANRKEFRKVRIGIEVIERQDAAQQTSEKSEIVKVLKKANKELRGVSTRCVGIGGGTVAYFFRKRGMPAAMWSLMPKVAHEPNEYAVIDYIVEDAKVFAYLCI